MRSAEVYCNGEFAGILTEEKPGMNYVFRYDDKYFFDMNKSGVSLTLPKTQQEYRSEYLFPFFFNMLSEGANRKAQSRLLKIDEKDHFGILLATAQYDTIGAITVKPMNNK
jgi:serine/threonine-protein kinase HipA